MTSSRCGLLRLPLIRSDNLARTITTKNRPVAEMLHIRLHQPAANEDEAATETSAMTSSKQMISKQRRRCKLRPNNQLQEPKQATPTRSTTTRSFSIMMLIGVTMLSAGLTSAAVAAEPTTKHENFVIQTTTTTTTTTRAPAAHHQIQEKQRQERQTFHLSHRQPPSLVPLTIERSSLSLRPTSDLLSAANRQQHQQLDQLQLPIELHLKLRPLALPLPPPSASFATQPPPTSLVEQQTSEESQTKRRRSLAPPEDAATGEAAAAPQEQERTRARRQLARLRLEAMSWQEAKRVLLSSVSPIMSQARLERRSLMMPQQPPTTTTTTTTTQVPPKTTTAPTTTTTSKTLEDETRPPPPPREVRRQRHSSQREPNSSGNNQQQQQDAQQQLVATLSDNNKFQQMAAAMLPFFWPSFQLAGKLNKSPNLIPLAPTPTPATVAVSVTTTTSENPSRQQTRPARNVAAAAANSSTTTTASTELRPLIVEPTTQLPVSATAEATARSATTPRPRQRPKNKDKPVRRKKQKKPGYLMGAQISSTPYPDSTRLASKYPMPKIKFTVVPSASTPVQPTTSVTREYSPATTTSTTSQPPLDAPRKQFQPSPIIPKELSKLIEQQLAANGSLLLKQHQQQQQRDQKKGLPPSTSISKVIRLGGGGGNETNSSARIIRLTIASESIADATTSAASASLMNQQQPDLNRTTTTTTQPPVTTTVKQMPTTSTTTSTTPNPTTTSRPTTTTTTMMTTTRATSKQEDKHEASNQILPEDELAEIEATTAKPASTRKPKYGEAMKRQHLNERNDGNNIKLFHFKRKPDMSKLPFYKKPLNYTELGWTNEQIQEHLDSVGFASLEGASLQLADQQSSLATNSSLVSSDSSNLLLKRKRRGKNQFERLMAELHGNDHQVSSEQQQQPKVVAEQTSQAVEKQKELVPVLKTRVEPLVMKPMFFVMNQKQRSHKLSSPIVPEVAPTTTTAPPPIEAAAPRPANKSSQPIVRMRRKHHGEQPMSLITSSADLDQCEFANGWRASSKPIRASSSSSSLLLVPSGLLTPSGSHLMPLFAPTSDFGASPPTQAMRSSRNNQMEEQQSKLVSDFFAWRPARNIAMNKQPAPSKPSGGLAPSGEENFLLAPTSTSAVVGSTQERMLPLGATQPTSKPVMMTMRQPTTAAMTQPASIRPATTTTTTTVAPREQQPPQNNNNNGELRVPKLLVKPMRPAKYSLNGYIPKPSLNQQQSALLMANQQQQQQQQQQSGIMMSRQQQRKAGSRQAPISGRDLDSSTSNEIFSRRRGLQQHLRQSQPQGAAKELLESFSNLLGGGGGQSSPAQATNLTRQMEENKRKYILQLKQQQQLNQSPVLSIQKANMIKAKLGLAISRQPFNKRPQQQQPLEQPLATANSVAHVSRLDPTAEDGNNLSVEQRHALLVGATSTGTIPKTDFECADKRGKFVSGLFADTKTGCQVWHLCSNNRKYSFLCPSGTIFSEKLRICDWRYNVRCENSLLNTIT